MSRSGVGAVTPRGFSLLEMLVVLFVVGIITSLVGLSVSSGKDEYIVAGEAKRFAAVAEFAQEEAELTGLTMGLVLDEKQYRWTQLQHWGWDDLELDLEVFGEHPWPQGLEVDLQVENVALADRSDGGPAQQQNPQVLFYASGEATPGKLDMREPQSGDLLWRIEWDLLGRFTLLPRGEEPDEAL